MPGRPTRAARAVEEALRDQLGGDVHDRLAAAQARIAWAEVMVDQFGHVQPAPGIPLVGISGGVARVQAPDGMLAQELTLRKPGLLRELNRRLIGRPGAGAPVVDLRVTVGRRAR